MKIGILTFHNAHNYGAVLQAYALKEKIRQLGHQAEIINYCNPLIEKQYSKKLKSTISWRDLRHPRLLFRKIKVTSELGYRQKAWEEKCIAFETFMRQYLLEEEKNKIESQDLDKLDYDSLIVGSDQIWESKLTGGLDLVYLLGFPYSGGKIAYAASRAGKNIPEEEQAVMAEYLNQFDFLSVREEPLRKVLEELLHKDILTTLDPTLLLKGQDYVPIMTQKALVPETYLFVYFVAEDEALMKLAEDIAKQQQLTLIELHYFLQRKYKNHHQLANIGPEEFLWYIQNAKLVLTNSFHGTVFSLLFHKEFYCVCKKNMRIASLLHMLGLEHRQIYEISEITENQNINYERVDVLLEEQRRQSLLFLKKAIEESVQHGKA